MIHGARRGIRAVRTAGRGGHRQRSTRTLVLLVRHGATPTTGKKLPGRAPGLHLSEDGQRQAEAIAKRIAELPTVAAVYASPLERARETAEAIARARGLSVTIEDGLNEFDPGRWTGMSLALASKQPEWRTIIHHPSGFRFPEGESFVEMQARMVAAIERLVARHPGETIVAVSHAEPIKAFAAHALGVHLDLFQRIVVSTCSATVIACGTGGPSVLMVNGTEPNLTSLAPARDASKKTSRAR